MATILSKQIYTPDDLLRLSDGKRFELVDGQLVEYEMGIFEGCVAYLITGLIAAFVEHRKLGSGFGSELGYRCFPFSPSLVRKPARNWTRTRDNERNPPQQGNSQCGRVCHRTRLAIAEGWTPCAPLGHTALLSYTA